MQLYNFHASSASFRVRIALAWKGISYEYVPVTLRFRDGDQLAEPYRSQNPQQLVPLLRDGAVAVAQSLAILEYLEEVRPQPPLLPRAPAERARVRVRSLACFIACEIQPLGNLRVERYLHDQLGADRDTTRSWRRHWIGVGFTALETLLRGADSGYCHGSHLTIADCCLVPQVYNALRPQTALDLAPFPTILRIYESLLALPAVQAALPAHQPDAADLKEH